MLRWRPTLRQLRWGGRLFVQGINESSPWDPSRLIYWESTAVEKSYHPLAEDRKVEPAEELLEVLRVSQRGLPAIKGVGAGGAGGSGKSHSPRGISGGRVGEKTMAMIKQTTTTMMMMVMMVVMVMTSG